MLRALVVIATLALAAMTTKGVLAADVYPLVRQTISVDGADRSYAYFVSSKAASFRGNPVVFALPDNGQTAQQFAASSGWAKVAEENGFAVVFPEPAGKTWIPAFGQEDHYLKAVFDHARTHLISRHPGDNAPAVGGNASGVGGGNNPIWAWEPLRYLTAGGAAAGLAQEFAMAHPGLFAAVATVDGAAYEAAFRAGSQPAEANFQHMRGKPVEPVWKQLKQDVPVSVWMFSTGAPSAALARQADYWRRSDKAGAATVRAVGGLETTVYANPANAAEQVRVTTLPAGARYDEALTATIWSDLFAHVARWTSSPNGDLVSIMPEAEVEKTFTVRSITVPGDAEPFKYYLKLPTSYRKGQHLPLVISAHGANEQAWLFLSKIKMHEVGEREDFITVYPNGHKNRWASSNPDSSDATFIEMLIKDVVKTYGADPTRVYMQGFSNGNAMTTMMALTRPRLFAAVSPNNGPGPLPKDVQARVEQIKKTADVRVPMMIVYGAVDTMATPDGLIGADGTVRKGIDALKAYNHITLQDHVERLDSPYAPAYDQVVLQGRRSAQAIDARYPEGRFQVWSYMSADPKPLNLLDVVWVIDVPHAYDLREAQMEWDFFKPWRRNKDGSLTRAATPVTAAK